MKKITSDHAVTVIGGLAQTNCQYDAQLELTRQPQILIPYDHREAITLRRAAEIAGKSETTMRAWCGKYLIGRRVVNGPWQVSRVALRMLMDNNKKALNAYLKGDRRSALVIPYFEREDIPMHENAEGGSLK